MLIAHQCCRPTAPKYAPEMKDDNVDNHHVGAGDQGIMEEKDAPRPATLVCDATLLSA